MVLRRGSQAPIRTAEYHGDAGSGIRPFRDGGVEGRGYSRLTGARAGVEVSMPQRGAGPDPQEQLERYEKEIHQLQTQTKFLEDETALLRRRLSNSPRQVKVL